MLTEAEAQAKERARGNYLYGDEAFEVDWPRIRAELAAAEMQKRSSRVAGYRDYMHGVPGGHSESLKPYNPSTRRFQ